MQGPLQNKTRFSA